MGGTYSSITSNSSFTFMPLLNKRPGSHQQYITTLALPNPSLYSIYFTNSDLVVLDDINLFTTFYTKTETDSLYGSLAQQNTWSNTNNFTSSTYFYKDVNIVNNQSGGSLSIVPLTNGQPTTINFYTNTSRSALSAGNLWTVGNTNNSFIINNNNIGSTIAINQTGDVNIPTGLTVSGVNYNTLVSTSTLNTTLTSYPTNTIFNNAMTSLSSIYQSISNMVNYVTSTTLTSTLSSYALSSSLNAYQTVANMANYITSSTLTSTLSSYAVSSSLSGY